MELKKFKYQKLDLLSVVWNEIKSYVLDLHLREGRQYMYNYFLEQTTPFAHLQFSAIQTISL